MFGQEKTGTTHVVGGYPPHFSTFSNPLFDKMAARLSLALLCLAAAMLMGGAYPPSLKARVGGKYGHLANQESAALLANVMHAGLQHVLAAHLSSQNNTPELARDALAAVLGCRAEWVGLADQELGFDWRDIR
jgi:hypothetical protein